MIKDAMSGVRDSILRAQELEGKSQYLLLVSAEDLLFSADVEVIKLLSGTYHGIDPFDYSVALNRAVELLSEGCKEDIVRFEVADGVIKIRPLIHNKYNSINEFFLSSKKTDKFILKEIWDDYLADTSSAKLAHDIFINPNASGLLRTDCNHIVYDDSCSVSVRILDAFTRLFHKEKLIPRSKLIDFIINNAVERETIIDFFTSSISSVLDEIIPDLVKSLEFLVSNGKVSSERAEACLKIGSLVSNVTWHNLERMNKIDPDNAPGFNIGLASLFDTELGRLDN